MGLKSSKSYRREIVDGIFRSVRIVTRKESIKRLFHFFAVNFIFKTWEYIVRSETQISRISCPFKQFLQPHVFADFLEEKLEENSTGWRRFILVQFDMAHGLENWNFFEKPTLKKAKSTTAQEMASVMNKWAKNLATFRNFVPSSPCAVS